jgi:hypothetical protein
VQLTEAELRSLVGDDRLPEFEDTWESAGGDRTDDSFTAEWRHTDFYVSTSSFPTEAFDSLVRTWATDMRAALERAGEPEGRLWELVALELFGKRELDRELRLPESEEFERNPARVLATDRSPARPQDSEHLIAQLGGRVADEHELIAYSLMDERSDFFGPIDRLRGEIEFRTAIMMPAAALVALLTVISYPLWLLGAVVPAGLAYHARILRQERIELITAALTTKRTRSPTLNRLEAAVTAAVEEARRRRETRSGVGAA